MQLVLRFRNVLPTMVVEELDGIVATIRAFFGVEHKEDGTHGDLHADSITLKGNPIEMPLPNLGPTYVANPTITAPSTTTGEAYAALRIGSSSPYTRVMNDTQSTYLSNNLYVSGGVWNGDDADFYGSNLILQPAYGRLLLNSSPPGANPRTISTILRIEPTGAIMERGRATPLGEWINVPYSAANFTANAGTWNVEAGDQKTFSYTLIGKTLIIVVHIEVSTLSASPTSLFIKIPGGFLSATNTRNLCHMYLAGDATGTWQIGVMYASIGSNVIAVVKVASTAMPNACANVYVMGQIVLEIQ